MTHSCRRSRWQPNTESFRFLYWVLSKVLQRWRSSSLGSNCVGDCSTACANQLLEKPNRCKSRLIWTVLDRCDFGKSQIHFHLSFEWNNLALPTNLTDFLDSNQWQHSELLTSCRYEVPLALQFPFGLLCCDYNHYVRVFDSVRFVGSAKVVSPAKWFRIDYRRGNWLIYSFLLGDLLFWNVFILGNLYAKLAHAHLHLRLFAGHLHSSFDFVGDPNIVFAVGAGIWCSIIDRHRIDHRPESSFTKFQ